jgi:succinate dehydrogenase/fumarate reductase-like Fe-S protein
MNPIIITIDDTPVACPPDISVLAALLRRTHQPLVTRTAVQGAPRGPLCAMGVCYECRVTINDRPHQLACQQTVQAGMRITTTTPRGGK